MTDERAVTRLRGVGEALAARLRVLGIETIQDLLFLLPLRYEDRTHTTPIGAVTAGAHVAIEGEVALTEVVFRGRRQMLCRIADGSGHITLRFFYFSAQQQAGLARGAKVRCYGEARRGPAGLEIVHPEYRRVDLNRNDPNEDHLTPIYPGTEGITQGRMRQLMGLALQELGASELRDWLPPLKNAAALPDLRFALNYVHRPPADAPVALLLEGRHPAQRRLAFEELLAQQLSLRLLRQQIQADPGWPLTSSTRLKPALIAALPFTLTKAQMRSLAEVAKDLAQARPMLRLVQGDVGCGKTLVAALAAATAVEAGAQVALMAPTELLAEQHAENFRRWFEPLDVTVALLTGRLTGRARTTCLDNISGGDAAIVIGTHALFQDGVTFRKLALVIIDEQHRFGVHQRLQLRDKGITEGRHPHQLIMTATPIPRTLAMSAYADLDVSVIDELPPGRTPVKTVALAEARRDEVVLRIHTACREGRQAYWVCPLIDESEEMPYQAAEETAAALAAALPDLRTGLVHGRMKSSAKERVMQQFKSGQIQLLVATTVIEVGVDVPNATMMVVENAERMGLAQLHQLRGRVGRGADASSCLLLYRSPLSRLARERLSVMRNTNDGFEVARRDLELRGPGELLGTRQTGLLQMRVADLLRDADLLPAVQLAAEEMLSAWPDNIAPLIRRWIGHAEQYGKVG